jgi:preprotein translocase subunit SecA
MPMVERINALEPEFERMSDDGIGHADDAFRATIATRVGTLRDELEDARAAWLQEPTAACKSSSGWRWTGCARNCAGRSRSDGRSAAARVCRGARGARRTVGLRHYDVQLIGGMVLHQGKIAEMKTGEGKTLVATLPLYLNALTGRGAHLVTPNDYLSKYRRAVDGPGLPDAGRQRGRHPVSAAPTRPRLVRVRPGISRADDRYPTCARSAAARPTTPTSPTARTTSSASTTCATTWCANWPSAPSASCTYAIVDEVDNILIDEARTPLIISGQAQESPTYYGKFAQVWCAGCSLRLTTRSNEKEMASHADRGGHRARRAGRGAGREKPLRRPNTTR